MPSKNKKRTRRKSRTKNSMCSCSQTRRKCKCGCRKQNKRRRNYGQRGGATFPGTNIHIPFTSRVPDVPDVPVDTSIDDRVDAPIAVAPIAIEPMVDPTGYPVVDVPVDALVVPSVVETEADIIFGTDAVVPPVRYSTSSVDLGDELMGLNGNDDDILMDDIDEEDEDDFMMS